MGARRFDPNVGRYLSIDFYRGALDDLELGADPLTGNKYGFAGANPINFVEDDGHDPWWRDRRTTKPILEQNTPAGIAARKRYAFNFFVQRLDREPDVSRQQAQITAAAIVGNLVVESNYGLDPKQRQLVGNPAHPCHLTLTNDCAFGIAQWTFVTRKEGLNNFAQGKDPQAPTPKNARIDSRAFDFKVQVAYVWKEFKSGFGPLHGTKALQEIVAPSKGRLKMRVDRATNVVMLAYEGPSAPNLFERRREAWDIYRRYVLHR